MRSQFKPREILNSRFLYKNKVLKKETFFEKSHSYDFNVTKSL